MDYIESNEPNIINIDSIEFWVGNAKSFIKSYLEPLHYLTIGEYRNGERVQYLLVHQEVMQDQTATLMSKNILHYPHLTPTSSTTMTPSSTTIYIKSCQSFIVTASISNQDTEFRQLLTFHNGDFIRNITFNCNSVDQAYQGVLDYNRQQQQQHQIDTNRYIDPKTSDYQTLQQHTISIKSATVDSPYKDVKHTFIERRITHNNNNNNENQLNYRNVILEVLYPNYKAIDKHSFNQYNNNNNQIQSLSISTSLDHIATCIEHGEGDRFLDWYSKCLQFSPLSIQENSDQDIEQQQQDIKSKLIENQNYYEFQLVENIGLKMIVLSNQPASLINFKTPPIMWVITEAFKYGKSQVEQFLKFNNGSGIQHLAFNTSNIFEAVDYCKKNKLEFIEAPDQYYQNLGNRQELSLILGELPQETIDNLKQYRILIDSDYNNEKNFILQIFSKPICDTPTFFFEFIHRSGALGFGKGNIKALFEAVEESQNKK